jgi:hypothetical protein
MTGRRPTEPVLPSTSAEAFTPPDVASTASWDALSLLPVAAFVFALVAWCATAGLAYNSESLGIAGATVAMFPTGFGATGLIARGPERTRPKPSALRLLAISAAGGFAAMLLFFLFMSAIWPSL